MSTAALCKHFRKRSPEGNLARSLSVENVSVAGWGGHEIYAQRIRSYTCKPISVEVRRSFPRQVVFRSQLEPTLYDYQTPELKATVGAGEKKDLQFEIVRPKGWLSKQNNVNLRTAPVE